MSWKEILKEDLESKILSEIEKEGGALGMKNLKQFGKESKIKQALSKLGKEGKIFMHEDGDIYTHKPEDIEKFLRRKNPQPQTLTKDGITFTDQRALDMYNQNLNKYPTITNDLRGQTVNTASIETAIDNASRIQRDSQRARQQYQQRARPKRNQQPHESVWRPRTY